MDDDSRNADADLPPSLKLLKAMVMVLTGVMIAGVVTVVVLLVMRLGSDTPALPPEITLPAGERALAVTQGTGWVAVVTQTEGGAQSIVILDALTGETRQRVPVVLPGTGSGDAPGDASGDASGDD
jgi:hypothetical protein